MTVTTVQIQKYMHAKKLLSQTTWAIILLTPHHLLGASGAAAFTCIAARKLLTVHKRRFFLKGRLSAVYITL